MAGDNEEIDIGNMPDEEFLALSPDTFDKSEGEGDGGKVDDEQTPEEIEATRRAALSDEERTAEDAAAGGSDSEGGDKEEEARRSALTQEERDEEDRRDALTDEEREAEDKEDDKVEEERRAALTKEERDAEDVEIQAEIDAAKKKEKPVEGEMTDEQYTTIGKQIMGEFKANGKPMKMKSVEDAIQLMQMGANYHQKMTGLRPSLKTLKLLENHGLLEPEKINFLIDLSQNKPEAITQLLRDSKIDPHDLDLDGDGSYVAERRTVNETELLLDEVLDNISTSEFYEQTLTVIGKDWDETSKEAIADDPAIIRTINGHMENGVFDQVKNAVAYERNLGKLSGVSDLDAYRLIGNRMHENKEFKGANANPDGQDTTQTQKKGENTPEQIKERKDRKRAASPSRRKKAPPKKETKYDPLGMSDEEFMKINKVDI